MKTHHTLLTLLLALSTPLAAVAHGAVASLPVPTELAPLARQPRQADAAELKFADMFQLPVGPLGLEPSARLMALNGKRVRLVGYMASAEKQMAGRFVMTPLPVSLGDEDESLSDDLPPSAVFVHLSGTAAQHSMPNLRGLLELTGTLRLGALDEPDGHVSSIRLEIDERESRRLVAATTPRHAARPHHNITR